MLRVPVQPELLRWARKRAGLELAELSGRFAKLEDWEAGTVHPTLKQLEKYARATRAPIGYFFLPEPPVERIPIPDFRTLGSVQVEQPSPDLLDTLHLCLQRQDWYRGFARSNREDPRAFVGSLTTAAPIAQAATSIRDTLGIDIEARAALPTWEEALRLLIAQAEEAGILVMVSGVVGSNTRRVLDPAEFRGFALADDLAPLIFVNGRDSKSAQMFTLAHELAHLWLGQSALTDSQAATFDDQETERWCNQVAAETLVPLDSLRSKGFRPAAGLQDEIQRLTRVFKVSSLVILRRIHDAGWISRRQMWDAYDDELERLRKLAEKRKSPGGSFYNTQPVRLGRRFARSVVVSALSGQTLFTEAFHLLGIKKVSTLKDLGETLGIPS